MQPAADSDEFQRFVEAQYPLYHTALAELQAGRKRTHWMWFIFPQLRGLGYSSMAHTFGLVSTDEARRYWQHELLGQRLRECTRAVLSVDGRSAAEIFGSPDDSKLRSCMTLFDVAAPWDPGFRQVLDKFFASRQDERTLELLSKVSP